MVHAVCSCERYTQQNAFNTVLFSGKRDRCTPVMEPHVKEFVFLVPVEAKSRQVNGSTAFDSGCYICIQPGTCPFLMIHCSRERISIIVTRL
jgi:hypothetical protein